MKLTALRLQNYRIHRELEVKFTSNPVLIHGANESGKSTLVEAIHRALFLKGSGTTELHKAMTSNHGGPPVVEVEFEADGKSHRLRKQFSGNNGTTTLESSGQSALTGDAAEEALARLLKVDGVVGGRGAASALPQRWAHLWVWQGSAANSPLETTEEVRGSLRNQLQSKAGIEVSSSPTDNALIERLRQLRDKEFTSNDKPKAGSPIKNAEERLETATKRRDELRQTLEQLQSAAQDFARAEEDLARHRQALEAARKNSETVAAQLQEVRTREQACKEKQTACDTAKLKLDNLTSADSKIRELEAHLKEKEESAAPGRKQLEGLQKEVTDLRQQLRDATAKREQAANELSKARLHVDALRAHAAILHTQGAIEQLEQQARKIAELQEAQAEAKANVTRLEAFSTKALSGLQKKQKSATEAQATLEAYALRLEVLASNEEVQVDEATLAAGASLTLTQPTEVRVGDGTRLRLTPGGGRDLETARSNHEQAQTELREALSALGVSSMEEAGQKGMELQQAGNNLSTLQGQLDLLKPEEVQTSLNQNREQLTRLQARRDLPVEGVKLVFKDSPEAAAKAVHDAEQSLQTAGDSESQAKTEQSALQSKDQNLETQIEALRKEHDSLADELKRLQTQLQLHREQWGGQEERSRKINDARATYDQAAAALEQEQNALKALEPEALSLQERRLKDSIVNSEKLLGEARELQASSKARLNTSGGTDPERELKEAEAEVERLTRQLEQLRQQADARKLLMDRLLEAQRKVSDALARPLEEAAAPYLELLFGPGSHARLRWKEDGSSFEGLDIDRGKVHRSSFAFDKLSQGTREQVALALRLAMAEVLAEEHDGCLPLVLDDALTHADRERIRKLQNLLYRGAERGLQILLLTCHPENYQGLTSDEIALRPSASETQ